MKIAFLITHLTLFGGGGKFLMDYANKFCDKGHKVYVIAQKINKDLYKLSDKIITIEMGGFLPSNPLYWLTFNHLKKRYIELLNNLDTDIVISIHFPSNYFCSQALKRKKSFIHVHYCLEPNRLLHDRKYYSNAPFLLRIMGWLLRTMFKKYDIIGCINADYVIAISKFITKRINQVYGINAYLHYIGIDIKDFNLSPNEFDLRKKLNLNEKIPIIFTLGFTHHMKGINELMYIFSKIIKEIPETILLIGGWMTKENKKIIMKIIKKLKILGKYIIFYGFIDPIHIKYFYKQSVLTLYTAINESFGLIPLESMVVGTPVVAFNDAGPSETIIDGKTGYLINDYDINDFAQKAVKLMRHQKLYEKFSKNAKEHVRNNFNLEDSVSDLENIIKKGINSNAI